MLYRKSVIQLLTTKRFLSTKCIVIPDEKVLNDISCNIIKPRRHPGILTSKTILLPEAFVEAVINATADYPIKGLLQTSQKFNRHLRGRVPPMEQVQINELAKKVQTSLINKFSNIEIRSQEDEVRFKQMINDKMKNILREKIYNWRPIKYDTHTSLVYLLGRSAAEYAVLVNIFKEIQKRDPSFRPRSLFDFGSGIGTGTWAANLYWKEDIFEYLNIDTSADMNDLAEILLQGGKGTKTQLKGVFYRQFLPAANITYDLVISAYSMLELPSLESRLDTVLKLWNKTANYLVIVEQGTNAGFKVINELRDFILSIDKSQSIGHVFSPCPHDQTCPRFILDDGTPCNFQVSHYPLPIGRTSGAVKELYSYVVLKKGNRDQDDMQWPRIVRPILVRTRHTICRTCTAYGQLREVIFSKKKQGKATYHCARMSKWGDLLPLKIEDRKTSDDKEVKDYDLDHGQYCD